MKPLYLILLLFCLPLRFTVGQVQTLNTDSLKRLIEQRQPDTSRVLLLVQMANAYRFHQPDSAIMVAQQAIQLARKLHFTKGEGRAFNSIGEALRMRGELPQALETQFTALKISRNSHYRAGEAHSLAFIGNIYVEMSDYQQGLHYLRQAILIYGSHSGEEINRLRSLTLSHMGNAYERMNLLDSALFYQKRAHALSTKIPRGPLQSFILNRLGIVQARLGNTSLALSYHRNALKNAYNINDKLNPSRAFYRIAAIYHQSQQLDSSLHYARLAFYNSQRVIEKVIVLDASSLLVKLYRAKNNLDSAFHYQQIAMATKDNMFSPEKFQRLQLLTLREQQRVQQLREEQARSEVRFQRIGLMAALGVILLIALLLWRHNRQQQHANQTLHQKNEQIESQRNALERTLTELKATQTQLVQSEKMASLGELTAGIAHEIQNPLNFVNNFSEVSSELVEELRVGPFQKLPEGARKEAGNILEDLDQNLSKIHHHGQRADAIVKNMLQHSRASASEKQLTNLNALAEEYLRLSYHGLRAKDKDFTCTLDTSYDLKLEQVAVVPQEIGRVLLNLYNNAFYAVQQKMKLVPAGSDEEDVAYQPTVKVTTSMAGDQVELRVWDKGIGIPESHKSKIFQPFFTTKPTGQGIGLGLSLSYDIITKSHGGELKVETKEGEYTEMIVHLPLHS